MGFDFQRFRRYLRDISIVIIGIVITFAGSELISRCAKQREMRTVMELLKEEVKDNIGRLRGSIEHFQRDSVLFRYAVMNQSNYKGVPADTLKEIGVALGDVKAFSYKKDAFEVLKNASLMQYVKDKELLMKVVEGYDKLGRIEDGIKLYNEYKYRVIMEYSSNQTKNVQETEEFLKSLSEDIKLWNFIRNAPNFFQTSLSGELDSLEEVVRLLNKEYKFKG